MVSVISTPLKTREEAGNRREEWCWGWREQDTIAGMLKSVTLLSMAYSPILRVIMPLKSFIFKLRAKVV